MNIVHLVGTVARFRANQALTAGNMRVATKRDFVDKNGEQRHFTDYHNVAIFGRHLEILGTPEEGDAVAVTGPLQTRSYEKNGEKVWTTEVVVSGPAAEITVLGQDTDVPLEREGRPRENATDDLDNEIPF